MQAAASANSCGSRSVAVLVRWSMSCRSLSSAARARLAAGPLAAIPIQPSPTALRVAPHALARTNRMVVGRACLGMSLRRAPRAGVGPGAGAAARVRAIRSPSAEPLVSRRCRGARLHESAAAPRLLWTLAPVLRRGFATVYFTVCRASSAQPRTHLRLHTYEPESRGITPRRAPSAHADDPGLDVSGWRPPSLLGACFAIRSTSRLHVPRA